MAPRPPRPRASIPTCVNSTLYRTYLKCLNPLVPSRAEPIMAPTSGSISGPWTRVQARVSKTVSIDADNAETRKRFEPDDDLTPDRPFDGTWAMTPLNRVLAVLTKEYITKGRADGFARLIVGLSEGDRAVPIAERVAHLGTTEGAVYTALHCLTKRNRAIVQREIAATLDDPSEGPRQRGGTARTSDPALRDAPP
jgi:hypothetical protein